MYKYLHIFFCLSLVACQSTADLESKVAQLQSELDEANKVIEEFSSHKYPQKLQVCEEVIHSCNDKVKELDSYIIELTNTYEKRISIREKHIKELDNYIDELEKFAKKHDPDGFWNRNKMLVGFIGGTLFCGTAVWGAGQLR